MQVKRTVAQRRYGGCATDIVTRSTRAGAGTMWKLRRAEARITATAIVILAVSSPALAGCGGMSFTELPAFPPPPTAAPAWPSGAAPRPAVTYPAQGAASPAPGAGSGGWVFEPTVDIAVSALGYWDDGEDGLRSPHRAAIFDAADGRVVVETTVRAGSPLDRAFRWEPVGPVVLEAGHEYVMAWDTPSPADPEVLDPDDACLALELRYLGCRRAAEGRQLWSCPRSEAGNVVLSGNFKYKPLPEAGSGLR